MTSLYAAIAIQPKLCEISSNTKHLGSCHCQGSQGWGLAVRFHALSLFLYRIIIYS